ncbi:unnamed protein product [Caenorhabditis bovis]|uniref:Fungal lipase-type domain-containing protein n=1 Tax=Caenorhabditis bovis TaxID=2654633 RepID=A0A8S1ELK1_9PELO|nr:unnamed protein product [Caenorhabditis bovis]
MILLILMIPTAASVFHQSHRFYNETEARQVFDLVAASYSQHAEECVTARFPDSRVIKNIELKCDVWFGSKCAAYVAVTESRRLMTIVFRGTTTTIQLFSELSSFYFQYESFDDIGEINHYFKKGHEALWPAIHSILSDAAYEDYDVLFTGHSLGGALAVLAAARAIHRGLRDRHQVKVLTFAEPRVGNLKFARNFDRLVKYSFRIVNGADAIVHAPPCHKDYSFLPSFNLPCDPTSVDGPYHHMTEVWYPNGMSQGSRYIVCDGSPRGEEHVCSNSLATTFANASKAIADHRKYFNLMVSQYGRAGCNPKKDYDESQSFLIQIESVFKYLHKLFY